MSSQVRTIADFADGPDRSVAAAVHALADGSDTARGIWFDGILTPWTEAARQAAIRIAAVRELLSSTSPSDLDSRPLPPHLGVLLAGGPEYLHLLMAAACSEIVVAGLNPTRRGQALARDIRLADCALVLTDAEHAVLLDGLDLGVPVVDVGSPEWRNLLDRHPCTELPPLDEVPVTPDDLVALVFTSGTSGEPKAVRITQAKIAVPGRMLGDRFGIGHDDCVYSAMPLFHSNAIMVAWPIALFSGCSIAVRRRFSASGWLDDVRRYGCTFANYVGAPLTYVLSTAERPDDAENPMRVVYGNEAPPAVRREFARRFGVTVVDGFGSSEGGLAVSRTPQTPESALGPLPTGVHVVHLETGESCPHAEFTADGVLANAAEAVGELVADGRGMFAGYYNDPAADASRLHGGRFWSGDLAYVDADGFVYFAGRSGGWMRVEGENLAAAPIERVVLRHPEVGETGVYAVPASAVGGAGASGDRMVGDAVACAVVLRAGPVPDRTYAASESFAAGFADFLAEQPDLGPKQWPTVLRVTTTLPRTASFKFRARDLTELAVDPAGDHLFLRAQDGQGFRPL